MENGQKEASKGSASNVYRLQGFIVGLVVAAVIGVAVYAALPGSKAPAGLQKNLTGTAVMANGSPILYRMFPKEVRQGPRGYDWDDDIGEVILTAFTWEMRGYKYCRNQILPISQNAALFSVLNANYGGDGRSNFALPNLSFGNPDPQNHNDEYFNYLKYQLCVNGIYPDYDCEMKSSTVDAIKYWADGFPAKQDSQFQIGQVVLAKDLNEAGYADMLVPCDGRTINIVNNPALFSLLSIQFGGDGTRQFKIPDLSKASPIEGAKYYIAIRGIFPNRN